MHIWGNFGYVLADLDHNGTQEIVTRDDRFSYAFASCADSRWPVRILRYAQALTVATPLYRSEIGRDANATLALGAEPGTESEQPGDRRRLGRRRGHGRHWAVAFKTIDRLSRSGKSPRRALAERSVASDGGGNLRGLGGIRARPSAMS